LTEIRERATEGQLAHATGTAIVAALTALETALNNSDEVRRNGME
jgi:hypothetical protein